MGAKINSVGLYIHFPFCIKKCSYCDFTSFPLDRLQSEEINLYIAALIQEVKLRLSYDKYNIDTIYFGGGTPSLISANSLMEVLDCICKFASLVDNCEVSIEANPETISRAKLDSFCSVGINRISLGIQSMVDSELKILGRVYDSRVAVEAADLIARSRLENYNFDLMYGIPTQSYASLKFTLRELMKFQPKHISAYELTLNNNTSLDSMVHRGVLHLPSIESVLRMQAILIKKLMSFGLRRYEVSNFSIPRYKCKHNLHYWDYDDYIGIGASASGFIKRRRYTNTSCLSEYYSRLATLVLPEAYSESLTPEQQSTERLMLSLRTTRQLPQYIVDRMFKKGLGRFVSRNRYLTTEGFAALNYITTELM